MGTFGFVQAHQQLPDLQLAIEMLVERTRAFDLVVGHRRQFIELLQTLDVLGNERFERLQLRQAVTQYARVLRPAGQLAQLVHVRQLLGDAFRIVYHPFGFLPGIVLALCLQFGYPLGRWHATAQSQAQVELPAACLIAPEQRAWGFTGFAADNSHLVQSWVQLSLEHIALKLYQ
ncbi:hypothetical protein D3C81_932020 [compost metagenome]